MGHHGQADRISPADAKIARERSVLEAARQRSTFFPPGDLLRDEPPDWLIPSASLGIEVSDLLPAKPHGAKFSGPQVSSFQQDVAIIAEELYYASHDAQPAAVLLYFRNDWTRKGDVEQTARALAGFVHSNYPRGSEECVTLTSMSRTVRGWVDGLSVVRILRAKGTWQAGGGARR